MTARVVRAFGVGEELGQAIARALFGRSFRAESPDVVARFTDRARAMDGRSASHALRAWAARPDALAELARVRAPSLVLVGEEDEPNPPAEAERVAAALADARLVRVERCGHTMPIERPAAVAAALDAFLASLPVAAS